MDRIDKMSSQNIKKVNRDKLEACLNVDNLMQEVKY